MSHSVTQIPYEERFSNAASKANEHWNKAIFENHYMLGDCVILEVPFDIPEEDIDHWIKENSQARGQDVAAFYYR